MLQQWRVRLVVALAWAAWAGSRPAVAADLVRYESKYYTIYTDLDPDVEREAAARMTRMADEYHDRTKAFAGVIRQKFPFYLFKSEADYRAAGGWPGTAGVFMGDGDGGGKLMAFAGPRISAYTWHTVQHEGFHQFAHAVIGGDIPVWLNEGLAEYFGEGLYTGDGFVVGVVPPWRLQRLKGEILAGKLKTVRQIMAVPPEQWKAEMSIGNYDQAWSMVHFLVHADAGRYAAPFAQCIRQLSAGKPFDVAWRTTIGPADGFEERWKGYWLAQPPSPTHDLYCRATVATLTSFLARATAQRQTFPTLSAFAAAAGDGTLKMSPTDWLPHSLLADALTAAHLDDGSAAPAEDGSADAPPPDVWTLGSGPNREPTLSLLEPDGTRMTGWFTLNGSRVAAVNVEVDDLAKVLAAATALRDGGSKEQARAAVQAALRQSPRSPSAPAARAFLRTLR
jgi:hypothetical protein